MRPDDFSHAFRSLIRQPVGLAAAIINIAVCLAAVSLLVGVVDALLLRPPAHVRDPDNIIRLYFAQGTSGTVSPLTSFPTYELLRTGVPALSGLAAQSSKTLIVGRGAEAREVTAQFVTSNSFGILGVRPALGRFFIQDEERIVPSSVVVLGNDFWRVTFGASSNALGQTLTIGNHKLTVIGVAPPTFNGIDQTRIDVWLPIGAASDLVSATALSSPTSYWINLFGRLDGPSEAAKAQATTTLRAGQLGDGAAGDLEIVFGPALAERGPVKSAQTRLVLWLAAGSLLLLLICCGNVANLMLARFLGRSQELAVRVALGATRGQLIWLVVVDGVLVLTLGALCAAVLVQSGGRAARVLLFPTLSLAGADLDLRMIWQLALLGSFAIGISLLPPISYITTNQFSLNPGIRARAGSRFQRAAGAALTVGQCAVTVVLLIGAGLFGRSFQNVSNLDLGLDTDHLIYASADLNANLSDSDSLALYYALSERVSAIGGIEKATVVMGPPLRTMWAVATTLPMDIWSGPNPVVLGHAVGSGYFEISGLRITRGRAILPEEFTTSAHVAVINESFAHRFWPSANPIGACLRLGSAKYCTHVVGIAVDTPRWSITADREYELYVPIDRSSPQSKRTLALAIRASASPDKLISPVRAAIQSASPVVSYASVTPLNDILAPQLRPWRMGATIFSGFSFVAVVLGAVGLYAVLAFRVAQERKDFSIRMALGASRSRIWRTVLGRGTGLCLLGTMIGTVSAAVLAPIGRSLVYRISVYDPVVFLGSAALVVTIGLAASCLPAHRATTDDIGALIREG